MSRDPADRLHQGLGGDVSSQGPGTLLALFCSVWGPKPSKAPGCHHGPAQVPPVCPGVETRKLAHVTRPRHFVDLAVRPLPWRVFGVRPSSLQASRPLPLSTPCLDPVTSSSPVSTPVFNKGKGSSHTVVFTGLSSNVIK